MGSKKYVVREGFNFRVRVETEKGPVEKIYSEGDTVTLEQDMGDSAHQLEYADDKDRATALKAEEGARKSAAAAQPQAGGFDQAALAAAISSGIADAFAALQAGQAKAP
jgi:hypothetical protein